MNTATQIETAKTAIEKLGPNEFAELVAWIAARRLQAIEAKDFDQALETVFSHHAPLLEKLAQ